MSSKRRKTGARARQGGRPVAVLSQQQQARLNAAAQAHARGELAYAEAAYRALVGENVRIPQPYCGLAAICARTQRIDEAQELWRKALRIAPGYLEAEMNLAGSYQQRDDSERAMACYRKILARDSRNVQARYLLGNVLKSRGEFAEASAMYEQVMAQQPDYTQAHFTYSGIHRYQDSADPHIAEMSRLLDSGSLPVENRIQLAFALAKAYEDLEDWPSAFRYLELGNRLRRDTFHYSIEGDAEMFENIIRTFNREDLARLSVEGQPSKRPIFVIGMPRSGTSLIEKILASHSEVYGAGELDYLYSLGAGLFQDPSNRYLFRPLPDYPASQFDLLGRSYLQKLQTLNGEARRVTDKMPFNLLMLGLIRIALPNAKIVHCVRDPRDTCLSIYRQSFTTQNYRFAYDLDSIGRFHNLYRRLMAHWHEVFPGAIYDISYESLTADPETEIRRLLEACELEWQADCLSFHQTPGLVKTASFYQVRQPMYTRSVGLWKKYEAFLEPLLEVLELD
jgi:tetratricopeptide (TPR) repeat protein